MPTQGFYGSSKLRLTVVQYRVQSFCLFEASTQNGPYRVVCQQPVEGPLINGPGASTPEKINSWSPPWGKKAANSAPMLLVELGGSGGGIGSTNFLLSMFQNYSLPHSPAGKKNRDFQNVFFSKLGPLTNFSSYGKGQTAKI